MNIIKTATTQINAIVATLTLILSTTICFIPILIIGLLKLIPNKQWKIKCTKGVDAIATLWCSSNSLYIDKIIKMDTEITGYDQLNLKEWYLVVANHQSWLDIVMLQSLLNRKIPVLKFFIKDQLKWIPLLGFSWWAMGCPFMKRYSKEYLLKNPNKKGQDLISTQKAIEGFKKTPASIMNFVEGTRFTQSKKELQNSPYTHLLIPKSGGISYIISSMGEQIKGLLDVTIVYPDAKHSLWDFLCKRIKSVRINIRHIPIPPRFLSSQLITDHQIQAEFKDWLNAQWAEKDNLITLLK